MLGGTVGLRLELTFSHVTVKVRLYQVEKTLAVGSKEIGVLSQEVQSPSDSFVLHSRAIVGLQQLLNANGFGGKVGLSIADPT